MKIDKLMSESAIAVGPETPLREVAAILADTASPDSPFAVEQLQVLGVVSEADILLKEQGPRTSARTHRRLAARRRPSGHCQAVGADRG